MSTYAELNPIFMIGILSVFSGLAMIMFRKDNIGWLFFFGGLIALAIAIIGGN